MTAEPALIAAIAGEDACIYAYGVIGAQVGGSARQRARRALAAHRSLRDRLQSQAADTVVPAAIAYDFPFAVTDAKSAKKLAALIEGRMVPVFADLAAATSGPARDEAVTAAMECAVRAIAWGGASQAFPQD